MTWLLPRIETTQGPGRTGARKGMDRATWQRASASISFNRMLAVESEFLHSPNR